MASPSIDIELVYDRYLGAGEALDSLHETLRVHAPDWHEGLRVHKSPRHQVPVESGTSGALRRTVLDAAGERGPLYRALVAEHGPGYERLFGSAELRGASPELVVVVAVDEDPFARIGGALLMGNHISLQLRRARVGGQPAANWARAVFEDLCARTSPAWGAIRSSAEYEAKVMSDEPQVAAVGRDFSRFLPGLFTANFFGAPYRQLIGRNRLLSAPAEEANSVNDGVLVIVGEDPQTWDTPPRQQSEQRVLDHLGREHFFSKGATQSEKRAPKWPS